MSKETLKINVTIPLEVPALYGPDGKLQSAPNHIAEFIDEFVFNFHLYSNNGGYDSPDSEKYFSETIKQDEKIHNIMASEKTAKALKERERLAKIERIEDEKRWEETKKKQKLQEIEDNKKHEKNCMELYGCSWANVKTLSISELNKLRTECGVYWKNGRILSKRKKRKYF